MTKTLCTSMAVAGMLAGGKRFRQDVGGRRPSDREGRLDPVVLGHVELQVGPRDALEPRMEHGHLIPDLRPD